MFHSSVVTEHLILALEEVTYFQQENIITCVSEPDLLMFSRSQGLFFFMFITFSPFDINVSTPIEVVRWIDRWVGGWVNEGTDGWEGRECFLTVER